MVYNLPDLRYQAAVKDEKALRQHMKSFKLAPKFSVGIWYFAPGGGRFHDRYVPDKTIPERIEMAKQLADLGVTGIEAHYPAEINENNIDLYKDLAKAGVKVVGIPFSHFFDKDFEFGSLSNPDPKIREKAIKIAEGGLKLVQEIGAGAAISWPGIDGYTYPLGTVYPWMWQNFETALAEAMDRVPGIRVAIEPKPYEPAPNNIYRTTAEGILAAQRIMGHLKNEVNVKLIKEGHALVGLNPEIGHVTMGGEPLAGAYSLVGMHGMLAHTHWNSQPFGNYDQDLNVGVVNIQEALALTWVLKMMGYKEFFGIDINPERMPVQKAIEINITVINKLNDRVESLPQDEIIDIYLHPDKHRGDLEAILARYI
ncbi:MAG: TIM barrel protein [Candidatus Lokiarchaeota archaeon]|nr:TIM barrel protein [Candidatus Lokiarchaeota archaeon]